MNPSKGDVADPDALYDVIIPTLCWFRNGTPPPPRVGCAICGKLVFSDQDVTYGIRMIVRPGECVYKLDLGVRIICLQCNVGGDQKSPFQSKEEFYFMLDLITKTTESIVCIAFPDPQAYVDHIVCCVLNILHKNIAPLNECWCCGATPQAPKLKCSGCYSVYYCNIECQRKDWSQHKTECKGMYHLCLKPKSKWIVLKK